MKTFPKGLCPRTYDVEDDGTLTLLVIHMEEKDFLKVKLSSISGKIILSQKNRRTEANYKKQFCKIMTWIKKCLAIIEKKLNDC